jgi:choline monooxygenase
MVTTLPRPVFELVTRLAPLVKARRTDYAESTMRIPMENYRDPGIFAAEMQLVMGGSPVAIAPSVAILGEDDYLTRQLPDGRFVIVARVKDGAARVLVNSCRHRGSRVVTDSGCARRFTCPYHGWRYDTSGALVGQPGRPGFDDVDLQDLSLVALPSEETFGIVWLLPDGSPGVAAHLGDFAEHLAVYDYASWKPNPAIEVEVAANWQVIRDEDGPAISSAGAGIKDAAHDYVLLGRNEPGCQHIHRQIAAALELAAKPADEFRDLS